MPDGLDAALQWFGSAKRYDLSYSLHSGFPRNEGQPAFHVAQFRRHGDVVRLDGGSSATEIFVSGTHVGTHIDALCHVSQGGRISGGAEVDNLCDHRGFSSFGAETIAPILTRGILLDVAAARGADILPAGYEITPEDLDAACRLAKVTVRPGDAVLVRTGWGRHISDPATFLGQRGGAPGPGAPAAKWLVAHKVTVTGAETVAYEVVKDSRPESPKPVHGILLYEAGINMMEVMFLQDLADDDCYEFAFFAAPLKISGASGAPLVAMAAA